MDENESALVRRLIPVAVSDRVANEFLWREWKNGIQRCNLLCPSLFDEATFY